MQIDAAPDPQRTIDNPEPLATDDAPVSQHFLFPVIRTVPARQPLVWLARAWADIRAYPAASLFYGGCFAGMGLLLLLVFRFAVNYTTTLAMGFMLLGPFLCLGLYDLSRQRETGNVSLARSLVAWRGNPGGIGIYVLILTVAFLVWARASLVTFALFETNAMPSWELFFVQLAALRNITLVVAFFGVGMVFATIVFAFSVLSIPHLLDPQSDAVTAAAVSIAALARNPGAMLFWAACIAGLIMFGLVTAYIGLLVTGPLIGHATWHAYRDVVGAAAAPPDH
jgi:uncharacterized membrane protein